MEIQSKQEIRQRIKRLRNNLSDKEILSKSSKIASRLAKIAKISKMDILHSYLPIKDIKEIDTFLIFEKLSNKFPKIKFATFIDNQNLESVIFKLDSNFTKDKWNIPIPKKFERTIEPKEIDVILVPCLAFDSKGNRIGYGRGIYDKFLSKLRKDCLKIGLCYDFGYIGEVINLSATDIALDFVATESRLFTIGNCIIGNC